MNPLALPWLRRVARSPHAPRMILRGSVATSRWCRGRPCDDVDHVVLGPCSVDEARAIIDEVLAEPDDAPLSLVSTEIIWAETPLPGVRARVGDGASELQIDVGWGDPLAAPPRPLDVEGVRVLAVTPETMFGWKVHGLVEHGGKWRAKDLFDLHLILEHVRLDRAVAPGALRLAFSSRGHDVSLLDRFLSSGEWGRSRGSRRKWETFRRRYAGTAEVPATLADVASRVRAEVQALLDAPR